MKTIKKSKVLEIINSKISLPFGSTLLYYPDTNRYIVVSRFKEVLYLSHSFKYFRQELSRLRKANSRNESRLNLVCSVDGIDFYNQIDAQQQINKGNKFKSFRSNHHYLGTTEYKIGVSFSSIQKALRSTDGQFIEVKIK